MKHSGMIYYKDGALRFILKWSLMWIVEWKLAFIHLYQLFFENQVWDIEEGNVDFTLVKIFIFIPRTKLLESPASISSPVAIPGGFQGVNSDLT